MVTGIGGVFIKVNDPKKMAEWYQTNFAIGFGGSTYVGFKWENEHSTEHPGTTAFAFFPKDAADADASKKQAIVNFRVKDIEALIEQLKANGVQVDDKPVQSYSYGKFSWCIDPEGNKIELWEPIDGIF
jgi:predicted enzyme related to lactoylglutathione lyase